MKFKYNTIEEFRNDIKEKIEATTPVFPVEGILTHDVNIELKVRTSGKTKKSYNGIDADHATLVLKYTLSNFAEQDFNAVRCEVHYEKKTFPTGLSENFEYRRYACDTNRLLSLFIYEIVTSQAEHAIKEEQLEERFYKKDRKMEIEVDISEANTVTTESVVLEGSNGGNGYVYDANSEEDIDKLLRSKEFNQVIKEGYHCLIVRYGNGKDNQPEIFAVELSPCFDADEKDFVAETFKYDFAEGGTTPWLRKLTSKKVYINEVQSYSLYVLNQQIPDCKVERYSVALAKKNAVKSCLEAIKLTAFAWAQLTNYINSHRDFESTKPKKPESEEDTKTTKFPDPNKLEEYSTDYINDWYSKGEELYDKFSLKSKIPSYADSSDDIITLYFRLYGELDCKKVEFLFTIPNPIRETEIVTLVDFRLEWVKVAGRWMLYGETRNNFGKLVEIDGVAPWFLFDALPDITAKQDERVLELRKILRERFDAYKAFADRCSDNATLKIKCTPGI